MSNRAAFFWTPFLAMSAAAVGVAAWNAGGRSADYKFFDELIEVKHLISSRYVDEVDEKKLREGAIKGMVEALSDPYTVYVPGSEQHEFNKNLLGEYVGIGAQVNTSTGWLIIVSPLEDSPAFRAGLMPDDKVLEIDGTSTQGLDVEKCVSMLTGEAGSPVKLKIDRKGRVFEAAIIREKIKTRSVKGVHRDATNPQAWDFTLDHARGIGYIRMTQFTPAVSKEVEAALTSLGAANGTLKGLILDVRSNPGGLLTEAEAIADMFLKDGVIVSTRGRAHPEDVTRATGPGTLPDFPIILMVNGESASASEILAGALQDNARAKVLGTRSYGKGSVQSLIQLGVGSGSELKMTEQVYYLPSGRSLTRKDDSADWGVDPSPGLYVPMTDDEFLAMIQVRRRLERLQSGAPEPAADAATQTPETKAEADALANPDWNSPDWIITTFKDPQLASAYQAMKARLDTGEWKATGGELPQRGAIAADELVKSRHYRERLIREIVKADQRIDALETAAKGTTVTDPKDLWADTTDLTGGTMEVKDKDGKVIAMLKITGNNIERWLIDADVEKK
jgi:carboxyl-terminal processing protease